MSKIKEVELLAKEARLVCEEFVKSDESALYQFHNSTSLEFMCATSSFFLRAVLRQRGLSCVIKEGIFDLAESMQGILPGHAFVTHAWISAYGYNVDITATQYDKLPPVYITPITNKQYLPIRQLTNYKSKDVRDWPKGQRPTQQLIRKLMRLYAQI